MRSLSEYYSSLGYAPEQWHVGPEHPRLEEFAINLLRERRGTRVLEIGYQAGGFAVPLILAMRDRPELDYLGVDSGAYENAVRGDVIASYLQESGVSTGYRFCWAEAGTFVAGLTGSTFDLVLLDHYKPLYPRELYGILSRRLVAPGGVVLIHDVLGRAAGVWAECCRIAAAFGYVVDLVPEVPGGLAVVRVGDSRGWVRWAARAEVEVRRLGRSCASAARRVLRPARAWLGRLRR